MEHDAQPHQGDECQLVKKEMGDHGKIPSWQWRNEGILPGLAGYRISRRMQVHDPGDTSYRRSSPAVSVGCASGPQSRPPSVRGGPSHGALAPRAWRRAAPDGSHAPDAPALCGDGVVWLWRVFLPIVWLRTWSPPLHRVGLVPFKSVQASVPMPPRVGE